MTVQPIDRNSSLARAALFAPRVRPRLRLRRSIFVAVIVLPALIFVFPETWFVIGVLDLFLVCAFAFTDERKKLPRGSAPRNGCGAR